MIIKTALVLKLMATCSKREVSAVQIRTDEGICKFDGSRTYMVADATWAKSVV